MVISVLLLGGPHIKVQFQALHLMVMALPDANRDTAQVCCISLMVCLSSYGSEEMAQVEVKTRTQLTKPAGVLSACRLPTAPLLFS